MAERDNDLHVRAIAEFLCETREASDIERIDALEWLRSVVRQRTRSGEGREKRPRPM